jgi:hypothetical protein
MPFATRGTASVPAYDRHRGGRPLVPWISARRNKSAAIPRKRFRHLTVYARRASFYGRGRKRENRHEEASCDCRSSDCHRSDGEPSVRSGQTSNRTARRRATGPQQPLPIRRARESAVSESGPRTLRAGASVLTGRPRVGALAPQRVAIGSPAMALKPIEVSTLLPSSIARTGWPRHRGERQ